jgi:copper transport protein
VRFLGRQLRSSTGPTAAATALVAAALATGSALLLGSADPAAAHATLIGTVPAADGVIDTVPEVVELRFDEPVETVEGAVQVFGPDGGRVDTGTVESADGGATLRAPVEAGTDTQGTYTVSWRVTSADSHTLSGSFVFHNGTQTGAVSLDDGSDTATDVVGGIGRWLGLTGTLAAVGAVVVTRLRPSPSSAAASPAGGGAPSPSAATDDSGGPSGNGADPAGGEIAGNGHGVADAARAGGPSPSGGGGTATLAPTAAHAADVAGRAPSGDVASLRLAVLAVVAALVGAVGALVALVAAVAESAGRNLGDAVPLVPDLAPETRTGQLALARVALGLAAAGAAAVAVRTRRATVPALVLAAGALVTWSLAGHAWTAPQQWVAVASDLAHLGAVAVWIGGLLALLVALPLLATGERAPLTNRFSGLAVIAAGVVGLSGVVSGWQQVRTLDGLTSTGYGRLLLAKVVGFAVLVALGWVNRSRLVPLVARTADPLRRSLRVEVLVAAAVLAVTAALIHQPPARSATSSEPFDTTVTADSGDVLAATVDPATPGTNDIHLYFYGPDGSEPLAVDAVQVEAGTTDVPARRLQITPVSTNHVTVAGASLPSAGTWTVEVTAVQAGEALIFTFEVPIA